MSRITILVWTAFLSVVLVGAAPRDDPEELLRRGNDAFSRGDFRTALDWYQRAEERSTDPGLVAFNEAAAWYRLGDYREAELHYRRCREDAVGQRRARVLFDLANAIVQRAETRDVSLLEQAIGFYEECLRNDEAGEELKENARDNLELARVLLIRAKQAKKERNSDNSDSDNPQPPKPMDTGPAPRHTADARLGSPDARDARQFQLDKKGGLAQGATSTQQPRPGMGNLPPIPDQDELAPLSPEDTTAYLEQLTARIVRERKAGKQRSLSGPPRGVKDW